MPCWLLTRVGFLIILSNYFLILNSKDVFFLQTAKSQLKWLCRIIVAGWTHNRAKRNDKIASPMSDADVCCALVQVVCCGPWNSDEIKWMPIQKTVPHPAVLIALIVDWFQCETTFQIALITFHSRTASVAMCSLFSWLGPRYSEAEVQRHEW